MNVRGIRRIMCLTMAAMFSAIAVVGCGGGDGDDDTFLPGLILPPGQAWTDAHEEPVGNRDGLIVKANGKFDFINDYNGTWVIDESGTYTISGDNNATGRVDGYSMSGTFRVSDNGDTLKLLDDSGWFGVTYVRTLNVTVGGKNNNSVPAMN